MWLCQGRECDSFWGSSNLEVKLEDNDHWLNLGNQISCVDLQQKDALEVWPVAHATARTLIFLNESCSKEGVCSCPRQLSDCSLWSMVHLYYRLLSTRGYNFVSEARQNRFVIFEKGLALRLVCRGPCLDV